MLFKIKDLRGIKSGEISLAFRKWKRPSVKIGTLVKTRVGQIEILDLAIVEQERITSSEAIAAGYQNLDELFRLLEKRAVGTIYRIALQYHSPDPRIELRNLSDLSGDEFEEIKRKLERLDKFSNRGQWTMEVLHAINQNPELRALDLADKLGMEKAWLKPNVRKLKNMGLTISHGVGYSLSPRGKVVFEKLKDGEKNSVE